MSKTRLRSQLIIIWALIAVPIAFAGPSGQSDPAFSYLALETALEKIPKAVFPETLYNFAPLYEGEEIKHDFVVHNQGGAPLVITNVHPDCGCSVASNPGQIPAGGRAVISVAVNTTNRGGGMLRKGFTVFTNDHASARVRLEVAGEVKAYLTIEPKFVRLSGVINQPLRQNIRITPTEGHVFTITEINIKQNSSLRYELKPLGQDTKAGYELVVENSCETPGNYRDLISIRTDNTAKPLISIPVFISVKDVSKK